MKIIIVGGGAAGASCAARLRRLDESSEILILEKHQKFQLRIVVCHIIFQILSLKEIICLFQILKNLKLGLILM